jgi:hypothetical protein
VGHGTNGIGGGNANGVGNGVSHPFAKVGKGAAQAIQALGQGATKRCREGVVMDHGRNLRVKMS